MPEQKKSVLLTQDENDLIFDLLGYKCQTLATTVVELYTTSGPGGSEWLLRDTGVLCLVKDHNRRSYFFRLYCPLRRLQLWEQEVYNDIQYLTPTPFLHTFEAENCIAGFNFASEDEGKNMQKVLLDTIEFKNQKRVERRNRYNSNISRNASSVNGNANFINSSSKSISSSGGGPGGAPLSVTGPTGGGGGKGLGSSGNKKGRKKVSKADIGEPINFRHVSHVGWDPNKGFDHSNVEDPKLKEFFDQAGVSELHLKDKETREFIYDFIYRNGGIEKVKEEMEPPPPVPQRLKSAPPRPPPASGGGPPLPRLGPPPPPPQRLQPPRSGHPAAPPPPYQVSSGKLTGEMMTERGGGRTVEGVQMTGGGGSGGTGPPPPPPPPPLPPLSGGPPPPPPPPPVSTFDLTDIPINPRDALMEELTRNRKQLKPLETPAGGGGEEKRLPPTPLAPDSHFQLMDQIKEGIKLKPVSASGGGGGGGGGGEPGGGGALGGGGLASALARALAERNKVICDSTDSGSDTDSEEADDEWD